MSMSIEWKGGDWNKLQKELLDEAQGEVRKRAERGLAGMTCPDHGAAIRWVSESGKAGPSKENLGRIEACCDKAAQLGSEAVGRALD